MRSWIWALLSGVAVVTSTALVGCGGTDLPWTIDPDLVDSWSQVDLTEDGFPVFFVGKVMVFRDDGTWRSDSADGGWSMGGYQTREGRLNYWIDASDDPDNVGHEYTFDYAVTPTHMTISGRLSGHQYVATFARM